MLVGFFFLSYVKKIGVNWTLEVQRQSTINEDIYYINNYIYNV